MEESTAAADETILNKSMFDISSPSSSSSHHLQMEFTDFITTHPPPPPPPLQSSSSNSDYPIKNNQEHGKHQPNPTKKVQPKHKGNKKQERAPRYAFRTKSEIDNLDDGYRWRKYGQKAVKNSPFPRSYYRCTNTSCGVKKRIERSHEDPSIVVTAYEGTHTHPPPISPPCSFGVIPETTPGVGLSSAYQDLLQRITLHQQPYFQEMAPPLIPNVTHPPLFQERPFCPSSSSTTTWSSSMDRGLLQDMLPTQMLKGFQGVEK